MKFSLEYNDKQASINIDKNGVSLTMKGFNKNDFVIDKVFQKLDKKMKKKKAKKEKMGYFNSNEHPVLTYVESDEPVVVEIL